MLAPGYLSRKLKGYERERQETIQHNLLQMEAAGIKNPEKFIFCSNPSGIGNGTDKRNKKTSRGDGDDLDYVPSDNGDEDPLESEANEGEAQAFQFLTSSTTRSTEPSCNPSTATVIDGSSKTQNKKRKRGPTKLKTIAVDEDCRVEVKFDEYGRPIGEGSTKLSSFLGALVRELVPYTLSDWRKLHSHMAEILWQSTQARFKLTEEWERRLVLMNMGTLWRASKSRFVTKLQNASTEEDRLNMQPYNIESPLDWKHFVKEKTSKNFMEKSNHFRVIRKKQVPHTTSRKGYARLTDEMVKKGNAPVSRVEVWTKGHTKANGKPVNTKVEETIAKLKKVETDQPATPKSSLSNLKDDALCKVIGSEKWGRVRGFGKGVTMTKLGVLSQVAHVNEDNAQLRSEMAEIKKVLAEKQQASEEVSRATPIVATLVHNLSTTPSTPKCNLVDWTGTGEVVAKGTWASSDPKSLVHCVPLGPNAIKVWVDVATNPKAHLWRPTSDMLYISDAVGTTVAWPADNVVLHSQLG